MYLFRYRPRFYYSSSGHYHTTLGHSLSGKLNNVVQAISRSKSEPICYFPKTLVKKPSDTTTVVIHSPV